MWTTLWILWALMFTAVEAAAIWNDKRGDTLSEHLRRWFRTDTNLGRTIFLIVSGVFMSWFVVHIATGLV